MDLGVVVWPGRTIGPHGTAAIGLAWGPWTLGLDAGGVLPSTLVDLGGDRTEATIDAGLRVGWLRPAGGPAVELGPGWAWERFHEAGALVDAGSLPTLTAGARWRFPWADWSVAPGLTGAYILADTHVHVGDATTTLSPWRVGLLLSAGLSRAASEVQALLERLPAAHCEAFVLSVVEEYTDEEVTALLASPVGTLTRRLRPNDLARALAGLYVATGRCDAALTRLHQLQARGALGDDAVPLGRCESTSD